MNPTLNLHFTAAPWMWELLTHLWQSTAVALAILGLIWFCRGLSARTRRTLGWIAVAKFALPAAWWVKLVERASGTPKPWLAADAWQVPVSFVAPPPLAAIPPATVPLTQLLVALWAVGALGLLVAWVVKATRIRKQLLTNAEAPSVPLVTQVTMAAARVGLRSPPHCLIVASHCSPGAVGIFAPVLILPRGLAEALSPSELQAILIHECVHLRRRDNLWAAGRSLFVASLWFNPIAWLLNRAIQLETEKSCDERVLELTGDADAYAQGIVTSVRHTLGMTPSGFAAATTPPVLARLHAILGFAARRDRPLLRRAVIVTGLALVALSGRTGSIAADAPIGSSAPPTPASPSPVAPATPLPNETPRAKIGNIAVIFHGDAGVSGEEVHQQLQSRKGEAFDEKLLDRDVRALYALGHFKLIEVKQVPAAAGVVNVMFELTPNSSGGATQREKGTLTFRPATGPLPAASLQSMQSNAGTLTLGNSLGATTGVTFDVPLALASSKALPTAPASPDVQQALRDAQREVAAAKAELQQMRDERAAMVAKQKAAAEPEAADAAAIAAKTPPPAASPAPTPPMAPDLRPSPRPVAVIPPISTPSIYSGLRVFEVKELDTPPVARFQARPRYPFELRRAGIEGEAIIDFIVDTDGLVQQAQAVSATHEDFAPAAVLAVSKWKFQPGKKGGRDVPTHLRMPIVFTIQ